MSRGRLDVSLVLLRTSFFVAFVVVLIGTGDFSYGQSGIGSEAPSPVATPELAPLSSRAVQAGDALRLAWEMPPAAMGPEGSGPAVLWDNGAPVDDFGDPASQLSDSVVHDPSGCPTPPWAQCLVASPVWRFIAAAADDFLIADEFNPDVHARITVVRGAFYFFQSGAVGSTPCNRWCGAYVTIYPHDAALNRPAGSPTGTGGQTGSVVASQFVPICDMGVYCAQMPLPTEGVCRPCFIVDIPVNVVVAKNTRYWLSIVPRFAAPPQSAWANSALESPQGAFAAMRGFPSLGIPYWSANPGNLASPQCAPQMPPPAGTRRDLAFKLLGADLAATEGACCDQSTGTCTFVSSPTLCPGPLQVFHPGQVCQLLSPPCQAVTGACCDDTSGACADGVNISDCQGAAQRFAPGTTCAMLIPVCGTNEAGACCFPNGGCSDLAPTPCAQQGGTWNSGSCATVACLPSNDDCADALPISDGTVAFDTSGATTDGPPEPACGGIDKDIWYKYLAPCTGTLTVSLCSATTYDSAVAVYEGCGCPVSAAPLGCDNDACAPGGASRVSVLVTSGNCYLIRVGGAGGAGGVGSMFLACVPAGAGACCDHSNGVCSIVPDSASCAGAAETFSAGLPCELVDCEIRGACCEDTTATCADNVDESDCAAPTERFAPNTSCAAMNPPCGTTDVGACCLASGACVALTPTNCSLAGGAWNAGDCNTVLCPQPNDECSGAAVVGDGTVPVDTRGATSGGPVEACGDFNQDLWYRYTAACDGTLTVTLCGAADFDSVLAVYDGCGCPPTAAPLACDNDACAVGGASAVSLPVTMGQCYLVRVGGVGMSSGTANMLVACVATGMGACCDQGTCTVLPQVSCLAPAVYTDGQPCTTLLCPPLGACCLPAGAGCQAMTQAACLGQGGTYQGDASTCSPDPCAPPPPCCLGDLDTDCVRGFGDVDPFVTALLSPPTEPYAFCRADMNRDSAVDGGDLAEFVAHILAGMACPPSQITCCKGDVNTDGLRDPQDVNGFVAALLADVAPVCYDLCRVDVNGDGQADGADVGPFVQLILNPGGCPPP